jgi:hypothetical protein
MTPTWDSTDLNSGTDDGVVHESTADTGYDDASEIRKGDATASPIAANDLILWYPLQEPSGASTAHDFSGANQDATLNGVTSGVGGLAGTNSMEWDDTDDFADIGSLSFSEVTVSFWIYWSSTIEDGSRNSGVFGNGRNHDFHIKHRSRDGAARQEYYIAVNDTDYGVGNSSSYIPSKDVWHHMTFRIESDGTYKQFANASLQFSLSAQVPNVGSSAFELGRNPDSRSDVWAGRLADVRVYDRALTNTEIQEIYDVFAAPSKHTSTKKQL